MTLRLGTTSDPQALWRAKFAQTELRRIGVESTLVPLENPVAAIWCGDIDATVQALVELPLSQPEGLVIAAVSGRDHPGDLLVLHPETTDNRQDFGLKKGAIVGVSSHWHKTQLLDFRPDLIISVPNEDLWALLGDLRERRCEAIVFAASNIEPAAVDLSGFTVLKLNPREFVPAPAQGVLAWLTHRDDLPVRRLLKQLHHPEVSACTNVERRVFQLLGGEPGVFVERDAAGNFHAFGACKHSDLIRRERLSQSTNFELAERLAERLR